MTEKVLKKSSLQMVKKVLLLKSSKTTNKLLKRWKIIMKTETKQFSNFDKNESLEAIFRTKVAFREARKSTLANLESYLKIKKNKEILNLFNGTNGRIVIDLQEDKDEKTIKAIRDEKLFQIQKDICQSVNDDFYNSSSTTTMDSIVGLFCRCLSQDELKFDLDEKGSIIFKRTQHKYFYEGMKISKGLLKIFEMSKGIRGVSFENIERFSDEEKQFKENFIGCELAKIIDRNGLDSPFYKDKYLVLSILPQDFYNMSNGNSWDSCLAPNGGYNSGSLTLSKGRDTIVSYLIKKEDLKNGNFKNTLIWRQLVAFNNEYSVTMSRPYPDNKTFLTDSVASFILGNKPMSFESGKKLQYESNSYFTGYVDFERSPSNNSLYYLKDTDYEKFLVPYKLQNNLNTCLSCGQKKHLDDEDYCCINCCNWY